MTNETAEAMRLAAMKLRKDAERKIVRAIGLERDAAELEPRKKRTGNGLCPIHGLPDCSPLLNGCSQLSVKAT